ncbi:MAG: heavy-metal-associated domain-containing protein [Chthonomonas sp.]|nr:heavy-metal-associated domain-containing protein [Chthonomonas sp.]
MGIKLQVSGMSCQHCVRAVTVALESVEGVESAAVDLTTATANVVGTVSDPSALIRALQEEGYDAQPA